MKNFDEFNKSVKCVVDNDDIDYAEDNDEMSILDYLKMVGDDICNYKSDDCIVNDCSVNFGDYSVNLELKLINTDKTKISKEFNSFCQEFEWCNKETLSFNNNTSADIESMCWDSTVLINPDTEDGFLYAETDFGFYDDRLYISVKLDG